MIKLSITLPTEFGELEIYANPTRLKKAEELIRKTPKILNDAYEIAAHKFANRLVRMAKYCLANGIPPRGSGVSWPPHAESTVRRLGEHTLLYWSSQYYHHIRVIKRGKHIAVGVPPGLKKTRPDGSRSYSELTLSQVAKILEFGSRDGKIPKRPLWQYLWPSIGGDSPYKRELVQQIRKQINKYK